MREPCYKCKFEHKPIDIEPCEHCSDEYMKSGDHPAFQWAKSPTNADRIRAMTDEELAEWFYSGDFPWCNFEEDVVPCPYEEMPDPCEHCLLEWLKEEVRE